MARPKEYDLRDNLTFDKSQNRYVLRNPTTGKRKTFTDEAEATKAADALNELLEIERKLQILNSGKPNMASLVEGWKQNRLQFMPWDVGTRRVHLTRLDRIALPTEQGGMGERLIERTDSVFLEDWLAFCKTPNQWNKWRYEFDLLFGYAYARKLCARNEGEALQVRSESKKLEINRKVRQPLDVAGFKTIHEKGELFLRIAMEQSLVTLQGRTEICNMRLDDYRGGFLYVIRDKVSGDTDMAFIRIAITEEIEAIRRKALADAIASPYLVHRKPKRNRRDWTEGKPHWSYVHPDYLTKAFAEARDATGLYTQLHPDERPSFHEIRGLGARIYEELGLPKESITALMTHADKATTEIYLEGGKAALKDDDFIRVQAPMRLAVVGLSP